MRLFAVIFNHCDLTSYHDFVLRFVMFFSATLMQPECGPQSTDWVAWWSTKQRSPEQIPMKKAVIKTSILMARTLKTEIEGKLCLHASSRASQNLSRESQSLIIRFSYQSYQSHFFIEWLSQRLVIIALSRTHVV